jgi:hypothetical protein
VTKLGHCFFVKEFYQRFGLKSWPLQGILLQEEMKAEEKVFGK